jgi:hypothetical protein
MNSIVAEAETVATCVLPSLPPKLDRLWETILDIGQALSIDSWMLVGGQMVMLHGLIAGRVMTRATNDIDVLAAVLLPPAKPKLSDCVRTVKELGFKPLEANEPICCIDSSTLTTERSSTSSRRITNRGRQSSNNPARQSGSTVELKHSSELRPSE